jgi:MerR family transcriptional regulator, light-induced transcriptional regulator
VTDARLKALGADGLRRFHALEPDAVSVVTERFYTTLGSTYAKFGPRGRDACREDLAFHLEFLQPVLEFGLLAPMVDYLRWLASVLAARSIPAEHLARSLDWLAEFFAARMEPPDAAVVTAALAAVRTEFLAAGETPLVPADPPELSGAVRWAAELQDALLAGDQRQSLAVVNGCIDSGHHLVDVERYVIQPAMYRIGEKWQANQVTVAQEHIATAIVQAVMTVALLRSKLPAPISRRVLLACVAGNHHTIGLRMVADSFQFAGWEIQYLGGDVPTPSLIAQIAAWSPDLVALSVSFAQQMRVVKDIIAQVKARFGPSRPRVIIGGLVINRFDRLVDVVEADACSIDAKAAIGAAAQLFGGQVIP